MLAVTNAQGMVGVVMPHGVLFRGGAEGTIRKGIVEADLFEAIIGLAPNLFFGASIPVAICVLNKAKPAERRGKVLFVDAAQAGSFRQGKAQNFIDPEHIARIVEAYQAFEDVERFAHVADLDEIQANDFNLNISRYVDTTEPVAVMSVEDAWPNCERRSASARRLSRRWTSCSRSLGMPKVRDAIRIVERDGWRHVRTRGSHRQFLHPEKPGKVTIPGRPGDDLPPGTWQSIQEQAGLRGRER